MNKILNTPSSIKIGFKYVFPDEGRDGYFIGSGYPVIEDCEGVNPEESYTKDYPACALEHVFSLADRVSEAYHLNLIPEGMTCREYFNKYKLPHIEIVEE